MSVQAPVQRDVDDDPTDGTAEALDGVQPALRGRMTVGHVRGRYDVYGGRRRIDGEIRHMANADPEAPGWLGNPHDLGDTAADRRDGIARFTRDFLDRVERDEEFRSAVEGLQGQRVGCWCRGHHQERTAANWCHLDVVAAWVNGDMTPVLDYLRGVDR